MQTSGHDGWETKALERFELAAKEDAWGRGAFFSFALRAALATTTATTTTTQDDKGRDGVASQVHGGLLRDGMVGEGR